jgi:hypothetical protein
VRNVLEGWAPDVAVGQGSQEFERGLRKVAQRGGESSISSVECLCGAVYTAASLGRPSMRTQTRSPDLVLFSAGTTPVFACKLDAD